MITSDNKKKTHDHNTELSLRVSLVQTLRLPDDAVDFLMIIWSMSQFFDDVVDRESIPMDFFNRNLWNAFVGLHVDKFFNEYKAILHPIIAVSILKWKASDNCEREGYVDERTYGWRAAYYDLVLAVFYICHGVKTSMEECDKVMMLIGESLEDYMEEFLSED